MNAQPLQPGSPSEQSFVDWLRTAFDQRIPPMTWDELALEVGVFPQRLAQFLDGERVPTPETKRKLHRVLVDGATWEEVLAEEQPMTMDEIVQLWFDAIPPEEFEKLPKDGAAQHDHYIYGTPKRTVAKLSKNSNQLP